jgi:hypothetical protein
MCCDTTIAAISNLDRVLCEFTSERLQTLRLRRFSQMRFQSDKPAQLLCNAMSLTHSFQHVEWLRRSSHVANADDAESLETDYNIKYLLVVDSFAESNAMNIQDQSIQLSEPTSPDCESFMTIVYQLHGVRTENRNLGFKSLLQRRFKTSCLCSRLLSFDIHCTMFHDLSIIANHLRC